MRDSKFDAIFGNWLPEEPPEIIVAHCPHCDLPLYAGDEGVEFDSEYFCSVDCMLEALGAVICILREED